MSTNKKNELRWCKAGNGTSVVPLGGLKFSCWEYSPKTLCRHSGYFAVLKTGECGEWSKSHTKKSLYPTMGWRVIGIFWISQFIINKNVACIKFSELKVCRNKCHNKKRHGHTLYERCATGGQWDRRSVANQNIRVRWEWSKKIRQKKW